MGLPRRSVEALRHCHVTNPGGHPAWFPDPPRVVLVLGGTNDLRSVLHLGLAVSHGRTWRGAQGGLIDESS